MIENAFPKDRIGSLLEYVNIHSKFYKNRFDSIGIDVSNIDSLQSFQKLPFTTKEDLQQHNFDFLCVDKAEIRDYVTTSGTAGDPVWFGLTQNDLKRLAYNESISFTRMGLRSGDVLQITTTLDRRFMAGLAYYNGAQELGIGVVRVGSGVPELQWNTINTIKPTALVCVPSFLLKLIVYALDHNIDLSASSVRKVLCIGEPIRDVNLVPNALSKRILDKWDVELYSTYASTEMGTAFTECMEGKGGHLVPDLLYAEIIDEQGNVLPNTEIGELVITTFGVEGMPLIRFKTGDIVQGFESACKCGDASLRLGPVLGRKNQMIKYKGTSLYPPAFFEILNDFNDLDNYIIEILSNDLGEDEIRVRLSTPLNEFDSNDNRFEDLMNSVRDRFRAKLRVAPKIVLDTFENINRLKFPENSRKSISFIDNRQKS